MSLLVRCGIAGNLLKVRLGSFTKERSFETLGGTKLFVVELLNVRILDFLCHWTFLNCGAVLDNNVGVRRACQQIFHFIVELRFVIIAVLRQFTSKALIHDICYCSFSFISTTDNVFIQILDEKVFGPLCFLNQFIMSSTACSGKKLCNIHHCLR